MSTSFKVVNELIIAGANETVKSSLQYQTLMMLKNSHLLSSTHTSSVYNMGKLILFGLSCLQPAVFIIRQ